MRQESTALCLCVMMVFLGVSANKPEDTMTEEQREMQLHMQMMEEQERERREFERDQFHMHMAEMQLEAEKRGEPWTPEQIEEYERMYDPDPMRAMMHDEPDFDHDAHLHEHERSELFEEQQKEQGRKLGHNKQG